jgi:hypothetical protein
MTAVRPINLPITIVLLSSGEFSCWEASDRVLLRCPTVLAAKIGAGLLAIGLRSAQTQFLFRPSNSRNAGGTRRLRFERAEAKLVDSGYRCVVAMGYIRPQFGPVLEMGVFAADGRVVAFER